MFLKFLTANVLFSKICANLFKIVKNQDKSCNLLTKITLKKTSGMVSLKKAVTII